MPASLNRKKMSGKPPAFSASLQIFIDAIADSGVFGDGFQIEMSPQTAAMKLFQAHTATGKLNARDDADEAERMPLLVHAVAGALGVHGQAVQLARQADGEVADVDHLLHFAVAFGLGLAHLQRDQRTQRVLVRAQRVGAQADRLAAARRRRRAPDLERGLRALDDGVVVGLRRGLDLAPAPRRWSG